MIQLFKPFMAKDVCSRLEPVLHSGYIGEGKKVEEFASEVGRMINCDNVLPVSSGTMAIKMALRLAGVKRGDWVLSTPMTCLATNEPVLDLGARVAWVDVDPLTGCMDADCLYGALCHHEPLRPKAILCMHWGGWPCDLSGIHRVAKKYGIPVIEDACQAFGSMYEGSYIGSHSEYVCLSFQAIKYITTGDGGALVCNDGDYDRARLMKWFGLDRTTGASMRCVQDPKEHGYKGQMNDIAATIGLANIRHMDWMLEEVSRNADTYDQVIASNERIIPQGELPMGARSVYWLYTIHVEDSDDFIAYMKSNNVACSKVHARNDTKQMFKDSPSAHLPGVDSFDKTHVCIPVGWWLSGSDVKHICNLLRKY